MSKRRKLFAFAMDENLKKGLEFVKERDGVSESEQARRAIEQWLRERKAVSVPAGNRSRQKKAKRQ